MRIATLAVCAVVLGCHHKEQEDHPVSCLIEHDGGPTQCYDEIGQTARLAGKNACSRMYGEHTFREGTACPTDGVVASCRKQAGTDLERIERCYRDKPGCEARCAKSGGTFSSAL